VESFGPLLAGIVIDEINPTTLINFDPSVGGDGWDEVS
jgi:hypothetical protein